MDYNTINTINQNAGCENVLGCWSAEGEEKPWWVRAEDIEIGRYVCSTVSSSMEAAALSNMLYTVEAHPLYADVLGTKVPVIGKYANVRTDSNHVLGVVGNNYRIYQNEDTVRFMDSLCGNGLKLSACGVLGIGERMWLIGRLPEYLVIDSKKNDIIAQYVCLMNGHDGQTTTKVFWTPVRVVCQNTERAALRGFQSGVNGISIKHTGSLDARMLQARNILGITCEYYDKVGQVFQAMSEVKVNREQVGKFLDHMFTGKSTRTENTREEVTRLFESGHGNTGETAWHLYNGYTEWYDYFRSYKETDQTSRSENRFDAIFLGGSKDGKGQAFEFIAEELCSLTI